MARIAVYVGLPLLVWWSQTRWLTVETWEVPASGLNAPLRVAAFADIHYVPEQWGIEAFAGERLTRRAVELASRLEPDLVVILGDLSEAHTGGEPAAIEAARILAETPSRYGIYAVPGNHDAWMELPTIVEGWRQLGITVLEDESVTVPTHAGDLTLTGFSWRPGSYAPEEVLGEGGTHPHLVLCHEPDMALDLADPTPADLILSGHTHGGQVWFPFVGAPWTPSRAKDRYLRGRFALGPSTELIVSRGVGTNFLPVRFLSRPEVALVVLTPR